MVYTQCDSNCLTFGTHWAVGIHTGYTQQATILLCISPPYSYFHTGYYSTLKSHECNHHNYFHIGYYPTLQLLSHWVHTGYIALDYPTLQLLSHWVHTRYTLGTPLQTLTMGPSQPGPHYHYLCKWSCKVQSSHSHAKKIKIFTIKYRRGRGVSLAAFSQFFYVFPK